MFPSGVPAENISGRPTPIGFRRRAQNCRCESSETPVTGKPEQALLLDGFLDFARNALLPSGLAPPDRGQDIVRGDVEQAGVGARDILELIIVHEKPEQVAQV